MALPAPTLNEGFQLHSPGDPGYSAACEFVAEQYRQRLGCELGRFYPVIACQYNAGVIQAAAGLRFGNGDAFFLEQYLPQPVDVLTGIPRDAMVEIGGFAATDRLRALQLMQAVAEYLDAISIEQVICTANRPIRGCLRKLGIQFEELGEASAEQLVDNSDDWGNYYQTAPLVLTGPVKAGVQAFRTLMECLA